MNFPSIIRQERWRAGVLVTLVLANLAFWGGHFATIKSHNASLISTGVVFSPNGMPLNFTDKLLLKSDSFSHSIIFHWANKTNTMQEVGALKRGAFGELFLTVGKTSSFGPSVLSEVELDDHMLFANSYMHSAQAKFSILPVLGPFRDFCYYFIYMRTTSCGTAKLSPLPAT
jgi:hypothetical protein